MRLHIGTLTAGVVFALLGILLTLDALEVVELDIALIGPVALITVGLALLAGWAAEELRR